MSPDTIIRQLERHRQVFQTLLADRLPPEYTWKLNPDQWCLLEIVNHLRDEEIEDFRTRVQHCLEKTGTPPPIDPEGWVKDRHYLQQDYETVLQAFLQARDESIAWLKDLSHPDWDRGYQHSTMGPLSARFFLTNWLAHDYLHLRQITRLQYDYLQVQQEPLSIKYAGNWV